MLKCNLHKQGNQAKQAGMITREATIAAMVSKIAVRTATVGTHLCGKAPHIRHTHSRAYRRQNKAPAAGKFRVFLFHRKLSFLSLLQSSLRYYTEEKIFVKLYRVPKKTADLSVSGGLFISDNLPKTLPQSGSSPGKNRNYISGCKTPGSTVQTPGRRS